MPYHIMLRGSTQASYARGPKLVLQQATPWHWNAHRAEICDKLDILSVIGPDLHQRAVVLKLRRSMRMHFYQ
jgi:hypothetical protein